MSRFPLRAALAAAILAAPAIASAHVTLDIREAPAAGYVRIAVRVPHGCEGSATTRIRIQIPDGVINVKPMPLAGWELTTVRGPLGQAVAGDHGTRVTEGVREIAWAGGRLLDEHYGEFVFRAQLPNRPGAVLSFPVVQDCERGVHRWIEIPAEGRSADDYREPAPQLRVTPRP